jgi:ribosome-associated protein
MAAVSRDSLGSGIPIAPRPGLPAGLVIAESELTERFSRSSGPGGQSVNTADSRVELRWDASQSGALTDLQRERVLGALAGRLTDGELILVSSEHRSQLQNRVAARARLATLVGQALMPPPPSRRPTKPSRRARAKRLDAKTQRGQIKADRGRVSRDD